MAVTEVVVLCCAWYTHSSYTELCDIVCVSSNHCKYCNMKCSFAPHILVMKRVFEHDAVLYSVVVVSAAFDCMCMISCSYAVKSQSVYTATHNTNTSKE
jgi:hypothetical protein